MKDFYYNDKSIHYGISRTRLRKILELVGNARGKRVLDVGCASGYLGKVIKERDNYVAGVEISQAVADEAKKVLDRVYVSDIEKNWPDGLKEEKFDLIILAETLEHVFNPIEVLSHVTGALNDGGEIIITTPNFMTWTNRIRFLFGLFKYQDQGMFDFGHIRWFTYDYLKEVLSRAGFRIGKENHIIFPGKLTFALRAWPSLFASQFIISAQKI